MGLFFKFKSLFNKTIAILPHQRNDVVSFVRLKNGSIKMGTDIEVEDNYNFIFVYYNKVYDILNPGTYKFSEDTAPRLFMHSKAFGEKGVFKSKSVNTDAYFVNLKEVEHNLFKTQDKIVVYSDDEKVKIRLEGNFSMRVVDVEKFMKALCDDYAVISNKKTVKEVRSTVSFEVTKALQGKGFTLEDFFNNKDKVSLAIAEGVNKHTLTFGIEVSKFVINKVIAPKQYLADFKRESNNSYVETNNNVDVVKMVEERLNSLQENLKPVYTSGGVSGEANKNEQNEPQIFVNKENTIVAGTQNQNIKLENSDMLDVEVESNTVDVPVGGFSAYENNQLEPNIIGQTVAAEQPQVKQRARVKKAVAQVPKEELTIDDEFVDNLIDKISKRKKQKKNNRIVEILAGAGITTEAAPSKNKTCKYCGANFEEDSKFCPKCGKSTEELIVCPCCGAKNFPNAKNCCICKSKL